MYLLPALSGICYISCDIYLSICLEHHVCVRVKGLILIPQSANIPFKALCHTSKFSPFPQDFKSLALFRWLTAILVLPKHSSSHSAVQYPLRKLVSLPLQLFSFHRPVVNIFNTDSLFKKQNVYNVGNIIISTVLKPKTWICLQAN